MIAYKFKYMGWVLLTCGSALAILYHINRIAIMAPVLAVHSSYVQTRYFAIIQTNIYEEITLICFLVGFLLIVFSREKKEFHEYKSLRDQSWRIGILLNSALLAFSILFIYGKGFASILIVNIFSTFAIYYLVFLVKKARWKLGIRE